jgi:TfoX/Sxy family transcriptional regulator of competence genes
MSTSKEYVKSTIAKLGQLPFEITSRPMMGEYLLYADGVLFGGLYDGRFLIKKTEANAEFSLPGALPYEGAKTMYQIEDLEDTKRVTEIIKATLEGLKKQ